MIRLIPRDEILTDYQVMPWIVYDEQLGEEKCHMPKGVDFMVLGNSDSTYSKSIDNTCKEIMGVFRRLKLNTFLIMGAQDTPWRFRQRTYSDLKVRGIMEFFTKSGIRPQFQGAVLISLTEFEVWFKNVLYAVRVNALVQEMFFMDINQSLYFSPCQYSNLHLTVVNPSLIMDLNLAINESELIRKSERDCGGEIYNAGGIKDRKSSYY